MIWDILLSWGISFFFSPSASIPKDQIEIGNSFRDLAPELKDDLSRSFHKVVDNRHFDGTAPNSDNCFIFNSNCQPDSYHTVYYRRYSDNKKHYDIITLSRNGYVLDIKDTYVK